MNELSMVAGYVRACLAGAPDAGDCSPVWQLGVIAVLIVLALVTLVVLRLSAQKQEAQR